MWPRSFLVGAVIERVPLGQQPEDLARREQAVGQEELVVGAAAPADPHAASPG